MHRSEPINEDLAQRTVEAIDDPVVRNLVMLGIAHARMLLIQFEGQSNESWEAGLPAEPFDMDFLARTLVRTFGQGETVRKILDGDSLPVATAWDV